MLGRFIFESMADFPPIVAGLAAGFVVLDWWGNAYLTAAGAEYLESVACS